VSFAAVGMIAVGLYLAGLAALAESARRARRDLTPGDHFLAGRDLGFLVLLLTIYATAHSGNLILGFPGAAYRRGFAFLLSGSLAMLIFVAFHLLAPTLRPLAVQHRFVTPGDLFRFRYGNTASGPSLRFAVGLLMSLALANFLLAQLVALGHVTHAVTGGAIPYPVGVVGFTIVIAAYETIGGMRAVAWTDALQGSVLLVGMFLLLLWVLGEAGGIASLTERVAAVRPGAVAVPPVETTLNALSFGVIVSLGAMSYPHAIQRIYAARSARALKRAFAWMGFLSLFMTATITLIGVAAIPYLEALGGLESDRVIPRLLAAWAESGPWARGAAALILISALAAIMSTADSVLLALSSILVSDLADAPTDAPRTTRLGKWAAVATMGAAALLALVPELTLWRLLELKMELLIQCAPALVLASRGDRVAARGLLAGILTGTALGVLLVLSGYPLVSGVHAGTLGLVVNVAVVAAWPKAVS